MGGCVFRIWENNFKDSLEFKGERIVFYIELI